MPRPCFSPATFRFLHALARNNNRIWFHANQADYERHVREPFLQLIADLQAPLEKISKQFRADPRKVGGSLFRMHRDTRFANDKTPYKTWAGARLFHVRRREVAAPSFYIHIQPKRCFVGAGLWHPESATLKKLRDFLIDNPAAWKQATRSKIFRANFEFWGDSLIRPPRGFDPNNELIDDIKRKSFAAGMEFTQTTACSAQLLPTITTACTRLAPMVDYLCAGLDLEF